MTLLKHVADVRVSAVDKKSYDGELSVRLCNYTDVYYGDSLTSNGQEYMTATASTDQVRRFRLEAGDSVVTKDSETADDIGVSAYIEETAPDFVCGYHLAIVRPRTDLINPRFLFWCLRSTAVREQLAVAATGVTRFGLRAEALGSTSLALPSMADQWRIADFLDDQVLHLDRVAVLRDRQLLLMAERGLSELSSLYDERRPDRYRVPLKVLLNQPPCYGVLVPEFTEGGVPFIRVNDLTALESGTAPALTISSRQSFEYSRTVVILGDVLTSVVGTLGKAAIVSEEIAGANVARAVCRLQPKPDIPAWFLRGWLATPTFLASAEKATGSGAAQATLNMGDLANFSVAVPTGGDVRAVGVQASELFAGLRRAHKSLGRSTRLLQERKQALITAAVTGRFDVTTARSVAV